MKGDGVTGDGGLHWGPSPKGVEHHLEGTQPNEEGTGQQSKVLTGIGHGEIGSSNQNCSTKPKEKIKTGHVVS